MSAQKKSRKEQPSVETVKEGWRVSDLLSVPVCNPLKEQLDKIKVCEPSIEYHICKPICKPFGTCIPIWNPDVCIPCKPLCKPGLYQWICTPTEVCGPQQMEWIQEIAIRYDLQFKTVTKQVTQEMKEMQLELKTIKAEIVALKKALK